MTPWIAEGREILARQSAASWEFADFLAGDGVPAEHSGRALAEAFGVSREKINRYRSVSKSYPLATRVATLTFTHHRMALALPADERTGLLQAAAREGWPVARLGEAVRDAKLEGKVRRQATEIRELKRQLRVAKRNAGDETARLRARLKADRGVVADAIQRYAATIEELADPELLDGLHGNARRGLASALARETGALEAKLQRAVARIDAALQAVAP